MIYNLKTEIDRQKFIEKAKYFLDKKKKVDLKPKTGMKTNNQNAYFHLICAYFGVETGYTAEYVKREFVKKTVNPSIFVIQKVDKQGTCYEDLKSWRDITQEEAQISINKFIVWAASEFGILMPQPHEKEFLDHCQNEIEMAKDFV